MERLTDIIERELLDGSIERASDAEAHAFLADHLEARSSDVERRHGSPMSRFATLLASLGLSRRSQDRNAA